MTRQVVAAALRFRLLVLALAAGLLVVGVAQIRHMPVDSYPEFSPPIIDIQTEALGLSAGEVEQLITVPLEADLLNGVAWLDTIRSESIPGLSSITLQFQPGTNLLKARQMTQERLNQPAAIPSVSKPPVMLAPTSSTSRTLMVGLSSEKLSLIDMSVLARWTIKPRLMGVPGVANVSIWGQRDRQLQVQVDPKRLEAADVSLAQVVSTAGNSLWVSNLSFLEASTPGTGGFFDAPNQRLAVRHVSPLITPKDLGDIPVDPADEKEAPKGADGAPLRLGDVTNVVEDHQPLIGDAIVDGKPGLALIIEKLPTAHTLEVTKGIDEALDALRPGLAGLNIDNALFRPAGFVHNAVHDTGVTLLIGFGLLILGLAVLLYQWRTALVAVTSITSAVVAAVLVLHLRGEAFNSMIFAGLVVALGVVVDDALLGAQRVAEAVAEHRRAGKTTPLAASVADATTAARRGFFFATLVITLPLLPVLFLTGLGRAFGRPLALTYVLALVTSMAVAMTITPALAVILYSRAPMLRKESPAMAWAARRYERLLARGLASTKPALVALGVLAVVGAVTLPQLWPSPLPTFKETDFLVDLDGAPGTSLPEMDRIATRAAAELKAIPGVREVTGQVGRALTSDTVVSPNSSRLWVSLAPHANYDRTVSAIRHAVRGYPGIDSDVMTYSEAQIADAAGGNDEPVVVRLFGQDLDILRDKAGEITAALKDVKGLTGLHADLPQEEPTLQVEVNLEAAKAAGIKPGDVRRASATLLSGVQVGSLFQDQKVFDVVVWGAPSTRQNVSTVKDLLIDTPGGGHVRLGDVARVEVKPSPNVIERDSVSRRVDVTAGIKGRGRPEVLAEVRSKLEGVTFPLEYHYELVGNYSHRQAVEHRLVLVSLFAALGIFLVLQALFGSWRLAGLAFLTLPFALVGTAVAVLIDGGAIELGALAGVLTVFGIAARQSVRLLRRFQQLDRTADVADGPDLVAAGARAEFGPTLLTTITTALVFAPFVLRGDLPGNELANPMGTVILGGLVTTAVVNLLVLPALYLRFHRSGDDGEELDLRDLWDIETGLVPARSTNGAEIDLSTASGDHGELVAQP